MNRNEVLESCYPRIKHGFFKVKDCPLASCGNNLEYAGKLMLSMTAEEKEKHKELVVKILKGMHDNILTGTSAFIPRTITLDPNDPAMAGEEYRWEQFTMEDGTVYYVRTDASYSQVRNMYFGADAVRAVPIGREVREKANAYILEQGFNIKRIDGKPAANGNFNTWYLPNVVISKYYLEEAMNIDHSKWGSLIYRVMKWLPCSHEGDNGENTIVLLYMLGKYKGYSNRVKKKIKLFSEKWLLNYRTTEYSDTINWLMFNKFYNEFQ